MIEPVFPAGQRFGVADGTVIFDVFVGCFGAVDWARGGGDDVDDYVGLFGFGEEMLAIF